LKRETPSALIIQKDAAPQLNIAAPAHGARGHYPEPSRQKKSGALE
jgi:hypothetical protein